MNTRKLSKIYLILFVVVVLIMLMLWQLSKKPPYIGARDYAQIKKEGVLRMVTEYSSVSYYIEGDTIRGFQYELAKGIENLSGLEVEIHLENSLEKSIEGLMDQTYDIIARNIPITTENKEIFAFTNPITVNHQVLVQRTQEANNNTPPIRNQIELKNETLHIIKNSPNLLRLRNLQEEIADTIIIVEDDLYSDEQLIYMVAAGDIDYAVVDYEIAAKNKENFPEIDIETSISFTQLQAWALRFDSPVLLDSLNRWLLIVTGDE